MEGTQIGSYRIERLLGQGGFGVVYVGVDVRLNRRAAIKQLLPELSGNRDIVERFFNEAKSAAGINHPGIVEIYDVGWHTDGSAYFAMKLLDGDSLAKRLRMSGPMPVQLAATIVRQVSSALVAAHTRGIVHRDLKPDNIMLVPDDEVAIGVRATVLDFGIAKLFGDKAASQKTRTGMMMGTPAYMSPEQCRGAGEVDHRTDVYALGCILFEMLSGRPPFVGEGAGEVLGMHQFVEPPEIGSFRQDLPPDLAALVMRTLAKRPEQRIQLMTELTATIQPFATGGVRTAEQSAQLPASSAQIPAASTPQPEPTPAHLRHGAVVVTRAPVTTLSTAGGEVIAQPGKRRNKLPLILGAAAVAIVAVVIIAIVGSSSSAPKTAAAPADAAPIDAAVVDAARVQIDAPPPVVVASTDTKQLLVEAKAQLAARKWADAIATAAKISVVEPANEEADTIARKAFAESKSEVADRDLNAAIARSDANAVKAAFHKVVNDSVYKRDARARYDKFVAAYLANVKRRAQALASQHKCKEMSALYEATNRVFPDSTDDLGVKCVIKLDTIVIDGQQPPGGPTVTELLIQAKDAISKEQYGIALRLAEQALTKDPGNQQALTAAAIAACGLKNADKAKKFFSQLNQNRQVGLRQICQDNNVSVD